MKQCLRIASLGLIGVVLLVCLASLSRRHDSVRYLQSGTPPTLKKLLYIVTSIAEFDNGRRKTVAGRDRFADTLVPVVAEGVQSMLAFGYQVDVYLIAHYELETDRYDLLRQTLPASVGLQVWDDATPLSYPRPSEGSTENIISITRALARQHRYVIKDKLLHYDFFVNFEDDMLIHGEHIQQYLKVSQEIDRLKQAAPFRFFQRVDTPALTVEEAMNNFYGPLAKVQLSRMIPGFIRVERANNTQGFQKRTRPGKIPPVDNYQGKDGQFRPLHIDPHPCCRRPGESLPGSRDLFLWETHLKALGIRQMPESSSLDWVLLQRGGSTYAMEADMLIGDYWAGRDGDFVLGPPTDERPDSMDSVYANNMGGWMATQEQVWTWHTRMCMGGLLPPFNEPLYPLDGMNHVVEYWSGGANLFGRKACHLQRIIPLDPDEFSRHLLYHTSNNKQKQHKLVKGLFSQAEVMLGQLHTVKQRAEQAIQKEKQ